MIVQVLFETVAIIMHFSYNNCKQANKNGRNHMIIREKTANEYGVYHNGESIGTVALSHNPYHKTNCYVKLDLNYFDPQMSKELFAKLKEIADCPLQVMTESDDSTLTAFLTAGGFICKRKCYEVEAGISDYIGSIKNTPPCRTIAGEPEYEQACRQMFEHYVATHETINPWTSDYETFRQELPETAFYAESASEIIACAFVEDNEIAYVCGKDIGHFKEFAQCMVAFILSQYETVCFESDDCDWAAMTLRSLFQNLDESSYDTYVCDNERAIFA